MLSTSRNQTHLLSTWRYRNKGSSLINARSSLTTRRWIARLLVGAGLIALLAAAVYAFVPFVRHAEIALNYPYPLNYGEGPLLDQAVRLTRGENIYRADLTQPPYTITNYPPVYVLAQAPFVNTVGAAFWYGRLISLISTLVAAVCLGVIARAVTKDVIAGIAAGVAFIAIPYIFHWSIMARIDALALALSLAGLALVAQFPRRTWALIGAALLLSLAAYTRQTYLLAAPLAAFAWLWARTNVTRALGFGVLVGSLVIGVFAMLVVATQGGIFFHIVTANVNRLDFALVEYYINEIAQALPIFLIGAGAYLLIGAAAGRPAWWLIAAYLLGATGTALTISKIGSDVNYLWEFSAALCLAAGGLIGMFAHWSWGFVPRALLLVALAAGIVMAADFSAAKYQPILEARVRDPERMDRLIETIRTTDTPILADESIGLLVMNGKPLLFQPFEMSELARAGVWDESAFIAALERGDYPLVMQYNPALNPNLRFERWTDAMLRAINNHYRPLYQSSEVTVYQHIDQ